MPWWDIDIVLGGDDDLGRFGTVLIVKRRVVDGSGQLSRRVGFIYLQGQPIGAWSGRGDVRSPCYLGCVDERRQVVWKNSGLVIRATLEEGCPQLDGV